MTPIQFTESPRRILLIKPSALGDVVHTLPVLNLLRRRWPEAHIAWLVNRGFASLLEGHPLLDEVIVFDRGRFGSGWWNPASSVELYRFLRSLRDRTFDLVIDLQGLFRSGWMTMATRAPVRVGFSNARELAHLFYTHRVPVATMEQHAIERYLSVCESLGCGRWPVEFPFHVTDADRSAVSRLVNDVGAYAVLLPGTNWPTKRWPAEHFAALVEPLRREHGLVTVVAGAASDARIASRIAGSLDLTGKTNLRELVALLGGASLVIANDSGPMHIAAALGRPLMTLFGPTNPLRTGPYERMDSVLRLDLPCSPCYSRECSHQSCLRWLTPGIVLDQIQAIPSAQSRV